MFKKIAIGFFIFPIVPMLLVDILFFNLGVNYFNQYVPVQALIVKVESQIVKSRRTRSGVSGAIYETYSSPDIAYEFQWNGVLKIATGVSLFYPQDGMQVKDAMMLKSDVNPSYKNLKVGMPVLAFVNTENPNDAFLYKGWNVVFDSVLTWIGFYFGVIALCALGIFFKYLSTQSRKHI